MVTLISRSMVLCCMVFAVLLTPMAYAETAVEERSVENQGQVTVGPMVDNAVRYLQTSQAKDGSFSSHLGPAITALVATGLMEHGRTPADPLVRDALEYVLGFVQEDGSICNPEAKYRNYETCVAIQCLKKASSFDGVGKKYAKPLAPAEAFLKGLQWDEEEGHGEESTSYGGAGYGKHGRPDLSNTTFLIDALHTLGRGKEDPAMQRALAFVSRTQNLETEHNTTKFAALVGDGGFYYTPAAGGASQAGNTDNGGLRSYGSMTYAGLKSMIYAGLDQSDPRVKAAYDWISRNYTIETNPGMGTSGLFYYYHTFAKALGTMKVDDLQDANGNAHNWRSELATKLASLQNPDGSWTNENERWLESDPNLSTAYSLLALAYCK